MKGINVQLNVGVEVCRSFQNNGLRPEGHQKDYKPLEYGNKEDPGSGRSGRRPRQHLQGKPIPEIYPRSPKHCFSPAPSHGDRHVWEVVPGLEMKPAHS